MPSIEINTIKKISLLSLIDSHLLFIERELGGDDRMNGEITNALKEMKEQLEAI